MVYRTWEEAARASKAGRAVSSIIRRPTPRGELTAVIVMDKKGNSHYAYGSANGIRIPDTYGRPTASEIDSIREWRIA
ncbi:MAG: hypothetical protein KKB59_14205 [Spirochaetes bacterium]|nr:hypothetical protein [Spirochaetota bacterium]